MGADLSFYKTDANGKNKKEIAYFRNYMPLNVAVVVIRDMHYPDGHEKRKDPYCINFEELLPSDLPNLLKFAGFTEKSGIADMFEYDFDRKKANDQKAEQLIKDIETAFTNNERIFIDYWA